MNRRLNIRAVLILLGAATLLGVGVHLLHGAQVNRQATTLLTQANLAEQKKNLPATLDYMRRYLGFKPGDTDVLARYAQLLADEKVANTPAKVDSALRVVESVLRRAPSRDEARQLAIDLNMKLGRYNAAQHHIEYLLNLDPKNKERSDSGLKSEGKIAPALSKEDPKTAALWGQKAECLEARARYSEARLAYEIANALAPAEPKHAVGLAYLLRDHAIDLLRRTDKEDPVSVALVADGVLDRLVKATANAPQGYVARARYRQRFPLRGGPEQTLNAIEQDLQHAVNLAPNDLEVLLTLAQVELDRRQPAAARARLEQAKEQHPGDWRPYQGLARVERGENRTEEALAHLRDGLKRLPGLVELMLHEADLLVETGNAGAKDAIARLKNRGIQQPELDVLSARILVRDRKWAEAISLLVSAASGLMGREDLARSPLASSSLNQCNLLLAQCYEQMGDSFRARTVYLRILTRAPQSLVGRIGVARMHAALGSGREAEAQYRQALLAPGGHIVLPELARHVLMRNLALPQELRNWEEVEESIKQAEQLRPIPAAVPLLRAEMLLGKGQIDAARKLLLDEINIPGPVTPPLALYLGMVGVEQHADIPTQALKWLERAEAHFGKSIELREAHIHFWASRQGVPDAQTALDGFRAELSQSTRDKRFTEDERSRLRRHLAIAYKGLGKETEARELWEEQARERPDDWSCRLVLIDLALKDNDESRVEGLLKDLRDIEKEDGVLWRDAKVRWLIFTAGRAERGDRAALLADARKLTQEIAARWPGWPFATLFEAQIEDLDGQPEKALSLYRMAMERGAATVQAVRRSMEILYAQQRFREAWALKAKYPRQVELSPEAGRLAALVSLRASDNADALARAERSVASASKDYRDYLFLGHLYWSNGKTEKAWTAFAKAQELKPDAPEVWAVAVGFLQSVGKKDQARAALTKAEGKAQDVKGRLALAQCYEIVEDKDRAAKAYAALHDSNDLGVNRAVAAYYLRVGDPKADEYLQKLATRASVQDPMIAIWARGMRAVKAALVGGNYAEFSEVLAGMGTGVTERRTRASLLATRNNARDRREAIRLLEELVGEGTDQAQEHLLLTQLYEANNEWPKARKQLLTLRKSPAGDAAAVLMTYASAMLRHEELDAAEESIGKLFEVTKSDTNPGVELARVSLQAQLAHRRDRKAEAVALLKSYALKRGNSFGQVATMLEGLKEYAAAEEMYRAHADKSPNPAASLAYAGFLGRRKQGQKAIDLCKRVSDKVPVATVIETCLAILESGDDDEALRGEVEQVLEGFKKKDPRSITIRLAVANLRVLQRRYADAEQVYRELIAEDTKEFLARNNLAWLLASQKERLPDAEKCIADALSARGPEAMLLDTQAVVHLASGKNTEAVKLLEELVRDYPRETTYLLHLAQAHAASGNSAAAKGALQKAQKEGLNAEALHPLERRGLDVLERELGLKGE
jgi:cellulose synthase operon protein C